MSTKVVRKGASVERRPRVPGRPRADAAKVAAAVALVRGPEQLTAEAAGAQVGLSGTTVREALKAAPAAGVVAPAPATAAAPRTELPQGGTVAFRSDLLVLVRRILQARDPGALAELDAGLLEAAKSEADFAAWLARPLPSNEDVDPLDAVVAGLSAAVSHAEKLSPLHPKTATVLGAVANLAARVEKITSGRPRVETVDEVAARIGGRRDEAVRRIMEHTHEARAKLTADRAALTEWARTNLGPLIAAELGRRLGAMLGETTS